MEHPLAPAIPEQIRPVAPGEPGPATAPEQSPHTCAAQLLFIGSLFANFNLQRSNSLSLSPPVANRVSQWAADFFEVTVGKYA